MVVVCADGVVRCLTTASNKTWREYVALACTKPDNLHPTSDELTEKLNRIINNFGEIMDMNIAATLCGSCLYANWGFADGEIFEDAVEKLGFGSDFYRMHDVLVYAVREKLLPKFPVPVDTYIVFSTHSPIRVADKHKHDGSKTVNGDVEVDITYEDVKRYLAMPPIMEIR